MPALMGQAFLMDVGKPAGNIQIIDRKQMETGDKIPFYRECILKRHSLQNRMQFCGKERGGCLDSASQKGILCKIGCSSGRRKEADVWILHPEKTFLIKRDAVIGEEKI